MWDSEKYKEEPSSNSYLRKALLVISSSTKFHQDNPPDSKFFLNYSKNSLNIFEKDI